MLSHTEVGLPSLRGVPTLSFSRPLNFTFIRPSEIIAFNNKEMENIVKTNFEREDGLLPDCLGGTGTFFDSDGGAAGRLFN